jgi:dimethylaniline monooxygenase (N-oxide forming)
MLKPLRENVFVLSLFERRSEVGGLWTYTDDIRVTTALPGKYFCPVL